MASTWTCTCGMTFVTASPNAGQSFSCPDCGRTIDSSASSSAIQTKESSGPKTPWPPRVQVEEVLEVIPVEEEEIPEVDVEEEDEPVEKPASFADRLVAAGNHTWSTIGTIPLAQPARCVAYGPGAAWGLAAQDDEVLTVNMHKGKKLDRFGGHDGLVTALAIANINDIAVSGDDEGDVIFWEIPACKRCKRLRVHEGAVTVCAIAGNLNHAATGDRRGVILRWGMPSGFEERLVDAEWSEKITALTFSPDSTLLAAGGNHGRVNVWSLKKGDRVQRFRLEVGGIAGLQFGPKNESILAVVKPESATVPTHPRVFRLDLKTGQSQECFRPAEAPMIFPACTFLTLGGKRLLCAGVARGDDDYSAGKTVLEIWHVASAQRLHAFANLRSAIECLAVTPENTRVLAATARRELQVFTMPERDMPGAPGMMPPETRIMK